MMGSAESVATAQHFVKERLKEIEARNLPAYLPAYLLTTAYVRRTRYSLVYLASTCRTYLPPCSPKAHNAQRAAGGGGALTQGASHSVAPHSAMGAPQVNAPSPTPATPLYPDGHPLHPMLAQPVLHISPHLCSHVCSAPRRRRASGGKPMRSRASFSRPTRRRSRRPSCNTACPICRRACSSPPWGRSPA